LIQQNTKDMNLIDRFKSLAPAKRKRILNAAINCNGRVSIGSPRFHDEIRYREGRMIKSTYPLSVMEVLLTKIKI